MSCFKNHVKEVVPLAVIQTGKGILYCHRILVPRRESFDNQSAKGKEISEELEQI